MFVFPDAGYLKEALGDPSGEAMCGDLVMRVHGT